MNPPEGQAYFGCTTCHAVLTLPWEPGEPHPWCVHANGNVSYRSPEHPTTNWTPMIRVAVTAVIEAPMTEPCEDCGGTGERILNPAWPSGNDAYSEKCSTCGGEGELAIC